MSLADADQVAAAVVTAFLAGYAANPQLVSQNIGAQRVYVLDIGDLDKVTPFSAASPAAGAIQVYVRANPEKVTFAEAARGWLKVFYPIQVLVAAKPNTFTPTDVDPISLADQELRDWFYRPASQNLPQSSGRQEVVEGDIQLLMKADSETLRETGLYLSEFIITFAGERQRQ